MKIENLKERIVKAEEKVEKCKKTIERHEKQLKKKQDVLIKKGYDISDLEAIKWNTNGGGSECYWEVCDVERKMDDIKSAKKKLEIAKETLQNWENKLAVKLEKERFLAGEAPQVIKDFLEEWKKLAHEWHIKRFDDYQKFKEKLKNDELKAREELGIERGYMPSTSQKETLIEKELDSSSIKKRKRLFAGLVILQMDEIYDESKRLKYLEEVLEKEKKAKMLDLINRINNAVGEITNAEELRIVNGNLNGIIIGKEGKAKVETISAGGWNIQCFHFRTLVNKI
ncbi:hypothetical protein P9294_gp105 [Bacillus phage FADO]|uniref:Uncharacterized protein n=1 Tax=Bacillus phage FADO TaxID=2917160 RepID=A0AAE9K5T4_9CAUD|nr:hypothetical protein P9294_gp105 [Bacillus phage FADO]UNY48820.1 hypothetical protein fado_105 [Bacillus phage FADO]